VVCKILGKYYHQGMLFGACSDSLLLILSGRAIRHRALALQDTANAIITAELEPEFEKHCQEIKEARIKRGKLLQELCFW
jgi:hypothetical protein